MKTYLVETESGFIHEELIHLQDAIEVGEHFAMSYGARVIIRAYSGDGDYVGNIVKVIPKP